MKTKINKLDSNVQDDFKYPFFLLALGAFLFVPSMMGQSHKEIIGDLLFVIFIISSL